MELEFSLRWQGWSIEARAINKDDICWAHPLHFKNADVSVFSKQHYPSSARNYTARGNQAGQGYWGSLNATFNWVPHDAKLMVLCKPQTQRDASPNLAALKFPQRALINYKHRALSYSAARAINCPFWRTTSKPWWHMTKVIHLTHTSELAGAGGSRLSSLVYLGAGWVWMTEAELGQGSCSGTVPLASHPLRWVRAHPSSSHGQERGARWQIPSCNYFESLLVASHMSKVNHMTKPQIREQFWFFNGRGYKGTCQKVWRTGAINFISSGRS